MRRLPMRLVVRTIFRASFMVMGMATEITIIDTIGLRFHDTGTTIRVAIMAADTTGVDRMGVATLSAD